ncbi:ATP-binding protein [uncultured Roseovarius sp.]|uniref:ATP-binding protein n=1 Tax=uncultured Roseovarius sp. TaxID=293344 RepID=UPI00262798F6|nr:ATP-binding protein [uncultured Roseovarius sp.]
MSLSRTHWINSQGRKLLVALSVLAAGCMVAAIVLTVEVFVRLDEFASANQDNVQWTTSRLEVDQLKFLAALSAMSGPDSGEVERVRRRYDVLYSRVETLRSAPVYREILGTEEGRGGIDRLSGLMEGMVSDIDSDPANLFAARRRLTELGNQMAEPIRKIATLGLTADAKRSDAERAALTSKIITLTIFILMKLTALFVVLVLVWRLYLSHRAQAEQSKSDSNRLETILNTSRDAVLVLGPDGRIIDTNARASEMLGVPRDAAVSMEPGDFLFCKQEDGSLEPVCGRKMPDACRDGPHQRDDLVVRQINGSVSPAELSADLAARGNDTICICFIRDISERVEAERQIASARDRALAGERAKARFLAMISHEMRTPLNGILGALELLNDTDLTRDQLKYTRIMQSSGQLLLTQITDALDLTQAAAKQIVLRPSVFDLDQLLVELVETQQAPAWARGNRLRLLGPRGGLGTVYGDRARIYQVLLNLVSNAIKFTSDGEITLEAIRTGDGEDDADLIEFQIADTGIGIREADLEHVFEDFVRATDITGEQAEGTGLGLGIARQLVKLMQGRIGVESEIGEGSLFWVRLPLPCGTGTGVAEDGTQKAQREETVAQTAGLQVLVVEDNTNNRVVIEAMLRADGHIVTLACDGVEALAQAQIQRFDLILMDINMPGIDGIKTSHSIRAGKGPNAQTPIVVLTAYATAPDVDELRAAGLDRLKSKPLGRDTLRTILSGTMASRTLRAQTPPQVDRRYLDELRKTLPPARIDHLLSRFKAEGDALLADIAGNSLQEPDGLADRMHQLAGTAATIGALALQGLLVRAETHIRSGLTSRARVTLAELPDLWQRTLSQLAQSTPIA